MQKHICPRQYHRIKTSGIKGRCSTSKFIWERHIILEPHTKVDIVLAANKVPSILTPDVLEKNVQDDKDDESVQCQ